MLKKLMITQVVCIILITFGIVVEFIYIAHLGFMAITIGSLLFAVTTKIENHYINKRKE